MRSKECPDNSKGMQQIPCPSTARITSWPSGEANVWSGNEPSTKITYSMQNEASMENYAQAIMQTHGSKSLRALARKESRKAKGAARPAQPKTLFLKDIRRPVMPRIAFPVQALMHRGLSGLCHRLSAMQHVAFETSNNPRFCK